MRFSRQDNSGEGAPAHYLQVRICFKSESTIPLRLLWCSSKLCASYDDRHACLLLVQTCPVAVQQPEVNGANGSINDHGVMHLCLCCNLPSDAVLCKADLAHMPQPPSNNPPASIEPVHRFITTMVNLTNSFTRLFESGPVNSVVVNAR